MTCEDFLSAQPHCPSCRVVMRDGANAFECPACGHSIPYEEVEVPPEFDGPEIR